MRDAFGVEAGEAPLVESGATFTELAPAAYAADLVLSGDVVLVCEVQLQRDDDKRWSWPFYATSAHARERRPTYLVVVAMDRGVAEWARSPIATFQSGTFAPLVIGPQEIPRVTSEREALAAPELAVLSALAHASEPDAARAVGAAGLAAAELVARTDEDRGKLYLDAVLDALGGAAREILEEVMGMQGYEYRSEIVRGWIREGLQQGIQQGREEGRLLGMRELVVHLCAALGVEVSPERRATLEGMDAQALEALSERIARERRWPD